MQSVAWITIPLGLLLIGLAVLDIFLTVLHVQGESPISNRVTRQLGGPPPGGGGRLPARPGAEVLGWGAPLMIGGILVFWSILAIVGFALLYLPFVRDSTVLSVSSPVP